MQLESHDLNTLRKIIRDLEEENRSLKSLLSDNGIVYESTSVYDEDVESRDVYDPDQGARIIKYAITRDMAKLFFYMFHGREDGVGVTLITMNPEAVGYEDTIEHKLLIASLQKAGVVVRTTDEYAECYAVIDKIIVWHGGMNLLGNTYKGDNLIRIENMQAAEELLEITDQLLK